MMQSSVGVVVIGRNEGERLRACLGSLGEIDARVYVDSGSTDDSCALARSLGFEVVELAIPPGFTAARARNEGVERLLERHPGLDLIQTIDGDCEMRAGWLESARQAIAADARRAVVFGRRRERRADANAYHRACDDEWNVATGEVGSCGGDALFRVAALAEVGGYNGALIAGEEPDLCLRLRLRGWRVWSTGREMTWHDIAMDRMGQWWRRSRRTGFAIAELVRLHGEDADPSWRRLLRSAIGWSAVVAIAAALLPLAIVFPRPAVLMPFALFAAAPILQIVRLGMRKSREGGGVGEGMRWAGLILIAKLAQAQGWGQFHWRRLTKAPTVIIEYKTASPSPVR